MSPQDTPSLVHQKTPFTDPLDRDEWLALRRSGIGGSEAAAILGLSPFNTPLGVWAEKTGRAPSKNLDQNESVWWGSAMEDLIVRRYMERANKRVFRPGLRVYRHPEHEEIVGTVDGLVIDEPRGLEVKTASVFNADAWGDEGTDQIPAYYAAQVTLYMSVTGLPAWDVAVLIGGNDFRIYRMTRDLDLEAMFLARIREWWKRHVVDDERPEASEHDTEVVKRMYPANTRGVLVEADALQNGIGLKLEEVIATRKAFEAAEEHMKNDLRLAIGDADGMTGEGWRVSWKRTKDSERVDWEAATRNLADWLSRETATSNGEAAEIAASYVNSMAAKYRVVVPGSRRFLYTPPKPKQVTA